MLPAYMFAEQKPASPELLDALATLASQYDGKDRWYLEAMGIAARGRVISEWPMPSARRLCELVLVSPGRRVSRDLACDVLFPQLEPRAAARALSKALSMARSALAGLGPDGAALLAADLLHIWASPDVTVDVETRSAALRAAHIAIPRPPYVTQR